MDTEEKLREETKKWIEKAQVKRRLITTSEKNADMLRNIDAYIEDAEHFLKNESLINAFEAVIWAWAWMEILEDLGIVTSI